MSAKKYHVNRNGEPGLCRADELKGGPGCPFGDSEHHYATPEAARKAYEDTMADEAPKKLKKVRKPTRDELALQARIEKWGPAGPGPNVEGLSSDDAFEKRKAFARDLMKQHDLTRETSNEVYDEVAHKAGIHAAFLKQRVYSELHEAERAAQHAEWVKKYGKDAPKATGKVLPGSSLAIDETWQRIPGEGVFKIIRDASGRERASIQRRDAQFIVGGRNERGGLVIFEKSSFDSEEEAIEYLKTQVR